MTFPTTSYRVTMHKVKVIVPFLLLVNTFLTVFVDATFSYDCKGSLADRVHIVPRYYKLKLNLSGENGFISGESQIFINIQKDTHLLGFDSFVSVEEVALDRLTPNISIKELFVNKNIVETIVPTKTDHSKALGFVTVVFNKLIQSGQYILRIKFSSFAKSTNTDGYIRASSKTKEGKVQWILATQTQVKGPQAIIPCWDNPHFKTFFYIIVLHNMMYEVVCNAKRTYQTISDSNMIWSRFESAHVMPAHCLDIAVVPRLEDYAWDDVYKFTLTMPVGYQLESMPDLDLAYKITVKVIKYLKEQPFVDQCKVAHTTYIPVRNFSRVILTTPSFILYREENITVSNQTSTKLMQNTARFIAEQIIYQWILRSTNPFYWSSSRLKDMSKYVATLILQVFPKLEKRYWRLQSAYKKNKLTYNALSNAYNALSLYANNIQFTITSKSNIFCDIYEDLSLINHLPNPS